VLNRFSKVTQLRELCYFNNQTSNLPFKRNSMNQPNKLTLKEKISYGFGDFASSTFWTLFSMFLLFFYTDVFGITAAAAGMMFLVARLWDTANDPIIGMICDRTKTRWGKFRPYLLYGALPFTIIGILTFTTPDLGPTGKLIYAYITYDGLYCRQRPLCILARRDDKGYGRTDFPCFLSIYWRF